VIFLHPSLLPSLHPIMPFPLSPSLSPSLSLSLSRTLYFLPMLPSLLPSRLGVPFPLFCLPLSLAKRIRSKTERGSLAAARALIVLLRALTLMSHVLDLLQ